MLRKGDFVGVVAEREWDAVRAAQQLKITWDMPATLPGSDDVLYDAMRAEKTTDRVVLERGDVTAAFAAGRARRLRECIMRPTRRMRVSARTARSPT